MTEFALVHIPGSVSKRETTVDLSRFLGSGIDDIVRATAQCFNHAVSTGELQPVTAFIMVTLLRRRAFPWLSEQAVETGNSLTLSDLDDQILATFVSHLKRTGLHPSTVKGNYKALVCLLRLGGRIGLAPPVEHLDRARTVSPAPEKHAVPYSRNERSRILQFLAGQLALVRSGDPSIAQPIALTVYYLLLSFRTGFNSTAILRLRRGALIDHPLRMDYKLLVSFKGRSCSEVEAILPSTHDVTSVVPEGIDLFNEACAFTLPLVKCAAAENRDLVFLRTPVMRKRREVDVKPANAVPLTEHELCYTLKRLTKISGLHSDSGEALALSTRRIRATLAHRVDEISGGDPFVKARILGNSPHTAAVSYSEPSPDSAPAFAKALDEFEIHLRKSNATDSAATPLGRCTDSLNGRYAPKDGVSHCERWLNCFRCPNQCITGDADDLWRLFSFYWALQRNMSVLRHSPISGLARFAIRVIETVVTERYPIQAVIAKRRARISPHPFWAHSAADKLHTEEVDGATEL